MMDARPHTSEHSEPIVFPPLIPLSGLLLGFLFEFIWPSTAWLTDPIRTAGRVLGVVLFSIGAAALAWMVATMKRVGTPIHNARTPTALVQSGPFRLTRNPMYLFGSIAYAGLSLLLLKAWCLVFLPLVVAATHYAAVRPEEVYLERHFGEAYRQYQARVRRWW